MSKHSCSETSHLSNNNSNRTQPLHDHPFQPNATSCPLPCLTTKRRECPNAAKVKKVPLFCLLTSAVMLDLKPKDINRYHCQLPLSDSSILALLRYELLKQYFLPCVTKYPMMFHVVFYRHQVHSFLGRADSRTYSNSFSCPLSSPGS